MHDACPCKLPTKMRLAWVSSTTSCSPVVIAVIWPEESTPLTPAGAEQGRAACKCSVCKPGVHALVCVTDSSSPPPPLSRS